MSNSDKLTSCPNCGRLVDSGQPFCGNCGQRLAGEDKALRPGEVTAQGSASMPPMPGPPPPPASATQPPASQAGYRQPAPPEEDRATSPPPPPTQPTGTPPPVRAAEIESSSKPPKRRRRSCLIGLAAFGALMLCGLTIGLVLAVLAELDPDIEPTVIPYSSSSSTESPLVVTNYSNASICNLYISPSENPDWGSDWLSDLGTIDPGFSATFYLTVGETVDMQIEDCEGYVVGREFDVTVPAEGLTYAVES